MAAKNTNIEGDRTETNMSGAARCDECGSFAAEDKNGDIQCSHGESNLRCDNCGSFCREIEGVSYCTNTIYCENAVNVSNVPDAPEETGTEASEKVGQSGSFFGNIKRTVSTLGGVIR